jgi:Protein of unknown function (DUF3551)
MMTILRMMARYAAALLPFAYITTMARGVRAYEYCRVDISYMRGCSFSTMEQCQAMSLGRDGTCERDPFYDNAENAYAYQPKRIYLQKRRSEY